MLGLGVVWGGQVLLVSELWYYPKVQEGTAVSEEILEKWLFPSRRRVVVFIPPHGEV